MFIFNDILPCYFVILLFLLRISAVTITSTPKPTKPSSSQVLQYTLTITKTVLSPGGYARNYWVANGQYPGPQITAWQNDTIRVNVVNNLPDSEGTSIHW